MAHTQFQIRLSRVPEGVRVETAGHSLTVQPGGSVFGVPYERLYEAAGGPGVLGVSLEGPLNTDAFRARVAAQAARPKVFKPGDGVRESGDKDLAP